MAFGKLWIPAEGENHQNDTHGRLRLRRVGDRLYADYWRDGQWVNLARRDGVPQGPAFIRLAIFGMQDGITVRFSNLTVER